MANIKELILSIEAPDASFDEKLAAITEMQATVVAMQAQEEQAINDNVDLIIEALRTIEAKVEAKLKIIPEKGEQGIQGQKGEQGDRGRDGAQGKDGKSGFDGKDGLDGKDGISVQDAKIDFDGSLVITLSDGREINVGEVVPVDVAQTIHKIQSGSGGDSQTTLNAIASLQATIATYGTMATQNANNVAITGGAINNATVGATTPAAGTFTTLTAQTEVLKGTGTNLFTRSSDLSNAAWQISALTVTGGQTDPFGGTTAALLNDGTTASTSHTIQQFLTCGGPRTLSVYAKAGTANFVALYDSSVAQGVFFNISTGTFSANLISAPSSYSITNAGSGWYRISITTTGTSASSLAFFMSQDGTNFSYTGSNKTIFLAAPQLEIGSTANTYIPTTTTAVYGTPTLSFSGVSTIGLQSDGSLYVSPAGTGALQAQATTSSATGGNARGANAVDWQTVRGAANQVASAGQSVIGGGSQNIASGQYAVTAGGILNGSGSFASVVSGGWNNYATANNASVVGGYNNIASGIYSFIGNGQSNTSTGYYNFIGGGFTNSGTANAAVTTQSGTMNGTTAVTLSGSNASIKVGQYISGTSISGDTYVAAISGTSLTLSKVASGSSTSTLSFYTPHGVVVGGGNNQATGSYSFIGGGGDAGSSANRNVASGDWSFVGGGNKNTASAIYATAVGGISNTASGQGSFIGGGGWYGSGISANTSSGTSSFVGAGYGNNCGGFGGVIAGGVSNAQTNNLGFIGGGSNNTCNATNATIAGGTYGTSRSIEGYAVFPAHNSPVASALGVSQAALLVLGVQTTDATATVLRSNTSAASGTNQVILPNNSAYTFRGEIVSGVTGGGNSKSWTIEGLIKRGADAASTTLVGSTVTSMYADVGAATWTIGLTADTTNGGLKVLFTGQASTTIRTVCQIRTTEMTY